MSEEIYLYVYIYIYNVCIHAKQYVQDEIKCMFNEKTSNKQGF